jgi:hypothetical protein
VIWDPDSADVSPLLFAALNSDMHKIPHVARWSVRQPRHQLHFTTISASWLNQFERFFACIAIPGVQRSTFETVHALETAIDTYSAPYQWEVQPVMRQPRLRS